MRMIMLVQFPVEPFNTLVRNGGIGKKMHQILEAIKPESAYFTERDGHRSAILVVNVKNETDVAVLAEPWFLVFNANVEYRVAMTAEDLGRANLGELGKTWA
ncbi:MAG: panthothenate synthetase [Terracidiphilus sp.]